MGIYYVGQRESDIATNFEATETDKFFSGSITKYGSNQNGNIACNVVTGMQLSEEQQFAERNHKLFTYFINNECRKIIDADPDAKFFPYSYFFAHAIAESFADRVICTNDPKLLVFLNSKMKFKKFIKGELPEAEFVIESGTTVLKKLQNGTYPKEKEVVIQTEYGEGGDGTLICTKDTMTDPEFNKRVITIINEKNDYVVSTYIKNICSIGVQVQISDTNIGVYPPSVQLLKGPAYAGSDVFAFNQLPAAVKNKCKTIATKFGKMVQAKGGRGFFGIDALVTADNKVFVVETNPRFTGASGLLNILSHKSGTGSIFEDAYRCFNGEKLDTAKFGKIIPIGRKRYANFAVDSDGNPASTENKEINREGFDKSLFKETGFYYSHTVFEEIRNYNTYDYRNQDREDIAQILASDRMDKVGS